MSTGPCEVTRIARDCQSKKLVVARPLVPKGLKLFSMSGSTKYLHIQYIYIYIYIYMFGLLGHLNKWFGY